MGLGTTQESPPPPPPPPPPPRCNITGVLHCQHRRDAGAMQYARPCFGAIYGACSQTFCSATCMHHFQAVIVVMLVVVMLSCLGDLQLAKEVVHLMSQNDILLSCYELPLLKWPNSMAAESTTETIYVSSPQRLS